MDRRTEDHDHSIESQLAALETPADWQPNPTRALARVYDRDRQYRAARKRWILTTAVVAVISLGVLAAPASCEAASPATCRRPFAEQLWTALFQQQRTVAPAVALAQLKNFRESGSASAPVTVEIYSDYECPACAAFFLDTMPSLMADYVQTGKVRIVHRDFPLPQHRYAQLAARYANAAGEVGQYDPVVIQLFRTQHTWEATGDVENQVLPALPSGLGPKVRELVNQDREDSIEADLAQARQDEIRMTPSLVVVANGKRQVIAPVPAYPLLQKYLASLLNK
jgi:protein-disulfide isomerase